MTGRVIRQTDRGFGLMFAGVFALLYVAVWFVFDERLDWIAGAAAVFLVTGLTFPPILMPLNRLWAVLASKLGRINNYLILGIFYYLIIVPFGLGLKLMGKDPMARLISAGADSYWQPVRRNPDRDNFHDMF